MHAIYTTLAHLPVHRAALRIIGDAPPAFPRYSPAVHSSQHEASRRHGDAFWPFYRTLYSLRPERVDVVPISRSAGPLDLDLEHGPCCAGELCWQTTYIRATTTTVCPSAAQLAVHSHCRSRLRTIFPIAPRDETERQLLHHGQGPSREKDRDRGCPGRGASPRKGRLEARYWAPKALLLCYHHLYCVCNHGL